MAAKRQVFYSFHYQPDSWRASKVRNIGMVEGNNPVSDNKWETIQKGGDVEIKRWINSQMNYRSCVVVLVGSDTASHDLSPYTRMACRIPGPWRFIGNIGSCILG